MTTIALGRILPARLRRCSEMTRACSRWDRGLGVRCFPTRQREPRGFALKPRGWRTRSVSDVRASGLLTRQRRLHFIGIGGAGMSGIAELSLKLGFAVSGCDQRESASTRRLASLGAEIRIGHHPSHLASALDAVVISSAVKFSNPEVA